MHYLFFIIMTQEVKNYQRKIEYVVRVYIYTLLPSSFHSFLSFPQRLDMVNLLVMHLHRRSDPLQARALLPTPNHLSNLSLALRTVQSHIILFCILQPLRRVDEIRTAGLAMQNIGE